MPVRQRAFANGSPQARGFPRRLYRWHPHAVSRPHPRSTILTPVPPPFTAAEVRAERRRHRAEGMGLQESIGLEQPPTLETDAADPFSPKEKGKSAGDGGSDLPPRHPLIEGMFQSLPENGQPWTLDEAADWLHAAAYNLRFAYKLEGKIKIEIEVERQAGE
jgi:hypothetical protein